MKNAFIAILSALLVLAFTPTNAEAKDRRHHRHHRDRDDHHDRDRYSYYHHDRGHHYGHYRHSRSVYRSGHWAWVNHHRVWIPGRTVVIYF
jgi:Ni/Co efflux regulator RcnB